MKYPPSNSRAIASGVYSCLVRGSEIYAEGDPSCGVGDGRSGGCTDERHGLARSERDCAGL